jgi:hypothetical protein
VEELRPRQTSKKTNEQLNKSVERTAARIIQFFVGSCVKCCSAVSDSRAIRSRTGYDQSDLWLLTCIVGSCGHMEASGECMTFLHEVFEVQRQ